MGLPNVDLSDIRETNKEQDKEINAISGATSGKADKATVDSLSGKVDTFMDKQDKINKWLAKGINKNRERIDKLESRDREITDKINEIVDDFNPIYDGLGNLSGSLLGGKNGFSIGTAGKNGSGSDLGLATGAGLAAGIIAKDDDDDDLIN